MSEKANLLIDVGNTSIKACFYDGQQFAADNIERYLAPEQLAQLIEASNKVYLSTVGKDDIAESIQTLCNDLDRPLFIAETKNEEFGLVNSYTNPHHMGVDRWLAMLACMHRSAGKTFLLADVGTAMTVDVVSNSRHMGGWIVPGLSLLKNSLFKNTQKVFGDDRKSPYIEFGNDTPACVDNGCRAQILGTLLLAEQKMKKNVEKFDIFLSGGDKYLLSEMQNKNIIECENLVLEGLTLFVD